MGARQALGVDRVENPNEALVVRPLVVDHLVAEQ
jgi:hypothetical protein